MCRLLDFCSQWMSPLWRLFLRSYSASSFVVTHQPPNISSGLNRLISWVKWNGEWSAFLNHLLKSPTSRRCLSLSTFFNCLSWIPLSVSSSHFLAASLSNCLKIITTGNNTDRPKATGKCCDIQSHIRSQSVLKIWLQPPVLIYCWLRKHVANPATCFGVLSLGRIDLKLHLS